MKQSLLLICLACMCLHALGQAKFLGKAQFESGYFINKKGQRTECLIKDLNGTGDPHYFMYKQGIEGDTLSMPIFEVKEFGIYTRSKYRWERVEVDISSHASNHLSKEYAPIFQEKRILLKVLIEGPISLYLYEKPTHKQFFFSKGRSGIRGLVYKNYINPQQKISTNVSYKQQLRDHLVCEDLEYDKLEKVKYKEEELVSFFRDYYICSREYFVDYGAELAKSRLHLSLRPGISMNSAEMGPDFSSSSLRAFGVRQRTGVRFGIEAEYILPFNKNRWSMILEPTFQYYRAILSNEPSANRRSVVLYLPSLRLSGGVRYTFASKNDLRFFIGGNIIRDIPIDARIRFPNDGYYEPTRNLQLFSGSLGCLLNNKMSAEFRYWSSAYKLRFTPSPDLNLRTFTFIIGYRLF